MGCASPKGSGDRVSQQQRRGSFHTSERAQALGQNCHKAECSSALQSRQTTTSDTWLAALMLHGRDVYSRALHHHRPGETLIHVQQDITQPSVKRTIGNSCSKLTKRRRKLNPTWWLLLSLHSLHTHKALRLIPFLSAHLFPLRFNSLSKVTTWRAPVQPSGCPSAIAPPRGLTFSMGIPSFSTQYTA